eukprot:gene129-184_t
MAEIEDTSQEIVDFIDEIKTAAQTDIEFVEYVLNSLMDSSQKLATKTTSVRTVQIFVHLVGIDSQDPASAFVHKRTTFPYLKLVVADVATLKNIKEESVHKFRRSVYGAELGDFLTKFQGNTISDEIYLFSSTHKTTNVSRTHIFFVKKMISCDKIRFKHFRLPYSSTQGIIQFVLHETYDKGSYVITNLGAYRDEQLAISACLSNT